MWSEERVHHRGAENTEEECSRKGAKPQRGGNNMFNTEARRTQRKGERLKT